MFSDFERAVFRNRMHEQHFRGGKIIMCDSDKIGKEIVHDCGERKTVIAQNARPCFRAISPHAVVFKSIFDSRTNTVHIAIWDADSEFTVFNGILTAENEVTYVTNNGEIFKLNTYSGFSHLQASIGLRRCGEASMFEDYFSVPNFSKSMLPYDFYSFNGALNEEERNKHLGSLMLFTLYLYLRNETNEFSDNEINKQLRNDLLFGKKPLTYERITALIEYLKNEDNYNDELGSLLVNTIDYLKTLNITSECLTAFFDIVFTMECDYSDKDEQTMLTLDPLAEYLERRYQAEKHHNVGDYFKSIDRIAKAIFSNDADSISLMDYEKVKEISDSVIANLG